MPVLDLDYEEDSNAEADSNFVLTGSGTIVEIQATGEKRGFSRAEFDRLFQLAEGGCADLFVLQRAALEAALKALTRTRLQPAGADRGIVAPRTLIGDRDAPRPHLIRRLRRRARHWGLRDRGSATDRPGQDGCRRPTQRPRRPVMPEDAPPPGRGDAVGSAITPAAEAFRGGGRCSADIGEAKAATLVKRCIAVSPATHPPCNAQNPCALIQGEIDRSCAMYGPGETKPAECAA